MVFNMLDTLGGGGGGGNLALLDPLLVPVNVVVDDSVSDLDSMLLIDKSPTVAVDAMESLLPFNLKLLLGVIINLTGTLNSPESVCMEV